jgi:hypothetical protein
MEEKINFEREFVFKVLDRLLNVGICRDMKCCKASNISPENFHDKDSYFDLVFSKMYLYFYSYILKKVTASGHGKEGSICFFERSVRPDVFTSVL